MQFHCLLCMEITFEYRMLQIFQKTVLCFHACFGKKCGNFCNVISSTRGEIKMSLSTVLNFKQQLNKRLCQDHTEYVNQSSETVTEALKEQSEWRVNESANRGGLLRIDSSTKERRFPAVHIILRVTGQLQGAIVLVHIPKHRRAYTV